MLEQEILAIRKKLNDNLKGVLEENSEAAVGQFKVIRHIASLKDGLAVSSFQQKGELKKRKADIKNECRYLAILNKAGIPALKVYGEAFELDGAISILVDWLPHSTLLDMKLPNADKIIIETILPALLLGVEVNSGKENWDINQVKKEIAKKLSNKNYDFQEIQIKAKEFATNFKLIITNLASAKLHVGDLQILASKDGKLTIIDPLAVLNVSFKDVLHPEKKTVPAFKNQVRKGEKIIALGMKFCEKVAECKESELIHTLCSENLAELTRRKAPYIPKKQDEANQDRAKKKQEMEAQRQAKIDAAHSLAKKKQEIIAKSS